MRTGRPVKGIPSLACDLGRYLVLKANEWDPQDVATNWPSPYYRGSPIAFFTEILGVTPWSKQIEIAEAVRDNPYVAVKGARKVGKTELAAMLALWVYCTVPGVAVWIVMPKKEQSDDIVWRAIKKLCREATKRGCPIGDPAQRGETGLESADGRLIKVITADETGARGHSGPQFYLLDEACDIPDGVYDTIDGNVVGGDCFVFALSNPLRAEGRFYDAFHAHKATWKTFTLSALETPNYVTGQILIKGLATREGVAQLEAKHGVDSVFYKHHVLGEFVEGEAGRINTMAKLAKNVQGWDLAPTPKLPLFLGIDPSGAGVEGDRGMFCALRGFKCVHIDAIPRGSTAEAYVAHLWALTDRLAPNKREIVSVCVDAEGLEGTRVYHQLKIAADANPTRLRVVPVFAGRKALRQKYAFELIRDELWACGAHWLDQGGKIPDNGRLVEDLHAPSWSYGKASHKQTATKKEDLKKMLGRSPDDGDAFNLACWAQTMRAFQDAPPTVVETVPDNVPSEDDHRPGRGPTVYDWDEALRR